MSCPASRRHFDLLDRTRPGNTPYTYDDIYGALPSELATLLVLACLRLLACFLETNTARRGRTSRAGKLASSEGADPALNRRAAVCPRRVLMLQPCSRAGAAAPPREALPVLSSRRSFLMRRRRPRGSPSCKAGPPAD